MWALTCYCHHAWGWTLTPLGPFAPNNTSFVSLATCFIKATESNCMLSALSWADSTFTPSFGCQELLFQKPLWNSLYLPWQSPTHPNCLKRVKPASPWCSSCCPLLLPKMCVIPSGGSLSAWYLFLKGEIRESFYSATFFPGPNPGAQSNNKRSLSLVWTKRGLPEGPWKLKKLLTAF